eukprot:7080365-Prymnesium_polylepis.1
MRETVRTSAGVQLAAASMLTLFTTAQSVLVELVKVDGHIPFHTPSAVLYTELVKLCVALAVWGWQYPTLEYTGLENMRLSSVLAFAVPATLFIVQNNVTYRAMSLLDPPTYQLWACFKLIPTGLLSRVCLGQRRSTVQWCALLLLALGMAVTKLDVSRAVVSDAAADSAQQDLRVVRGIGWMLLNGCLSATSGVANEWLIKVQDPRAPLMLKNAQIYAFGVLVSAPTWRPPAKGGLEGFSRLACFILLINAATGFSVSVVLKYTDNLVKGFSTSAAVLLATLVATLCCTFQITQAFTVGVLVVTCSFYLYFGDHNRLLLEGAPDASINAIATCVADKRSAQPTGDEESGLLGSAGAPSAAEACSPSPRPQR